jgi:hypothetical protein
MQKKMFLTSLFLVAFFITGTGLAENWVKNAEILASAEPQECYAGLGLRVDPIDDDPFTCPTEAEVVGEDGLPVTVPVVPYTPQTYVWSLVQSDNNTLWFGTGANVMCTTQGALISEVGAGGYGTSVCEFGESWIFESIPNLPAQYGDWRPPRIYSYDLTTKQKIDRTPYSDPLINRCFGLRSAGTHNGVAFLAGGRIGGGVAMFAYNASTGAYLGSKVFSEYRTIRKWIVVNNQLYTGMGTDYQGRILKWTGSLTNPFSFIVVGSVTGAIREFAEYTDGAGKKRIAVTAKGVFLSPAIQGTGLTAQSRWTQIWNLNQYDPDWVTRSTYVGGGIEFINGWLYFGTMHIPGNASDLHRTCILQPIGTTISPDLCMGEPQNDAEESALWSGPSRATSVWRIKNAESTSRVTQLLYGEAQLPAYDPETRSFPLVDNMGGYIPLLGKSGFGSSRNGYSWVMEVTDNKLFIGTSDFGSTGADLWRIDATADDVPVPAVSETTSAFKTEFLLYNNSVNEPYGFRCLIKSTDGTKLYAGMATGVNLGPVEDGAGFKLLELDSVAPPVDPAPVE